LFGFFCNRYRHDLLDNGFGVEWMDDNDENNSTNSKHSVISVRSVYSNHNTRLPAHIWRSLSKVNYQKFFEFNRFFCILKIVPGDVVMELNGVNTTGQTVAECKNKFDYSIEFYFF